MNPSNWMRASRTLSSTSLARCIHVYKFQFAKNGYEFVVLILNAFEQNKRHLVEHCANNMFVY